MFWDSAGSSLISQNLVAGEAAEVIGQNCVCSEIKIDSFEEENEGEKKNKEARMHSKEVVRISQTSQCMKTKREYKLGKDILGKRRTSNY